MTSAPAAETVVLHGNKAHSDGGWDTAAGGFVPVQTRSDRFTSTDPSAFADVTGFEAEWKLTPLKLVAPLINDSLDGSAYEIDAAGTTPEWIDRTDAPRNTHFQTL